VVDEDVVAVDLERDVRLADVGSADPEVDVGESGGVGRVTLVPALAGVVLLPPALPFPESSFPCSSSTARIQGDPSLSAEKGRS
jgi:hypothetical protein